MLDPLYKENIYLNYTIDRSEVEHVVYGAKSGKAVGPDKIPNDVLKHPFIITIIIIDILHKLFNYCFDTGIIPSIWRKAIITPLPKDLT